MKTIDIRIRLYLFTVAYQYTPEVPGVLDKAPENCYETEPAEIYIDSITLPLCDIDIKDILSDDILNEIEDKIVEVEES